MSLDELLRNLRAGEPRAEERLFRQLGRELLPYLRKRVGTQDAEELVQLTLAMVHEKLETFAPVSSTAFRSYVFTVAYYRVMSHQRTLARRQREEDASGDWLADPGPNPEDVTFWKERRAIFRAALEELRSTLRRAVESRLREEDQRQAAQAEGITVGSLRSRVHRALVALREIIETRYETTREATSTTS